ncbi:hypothetical protein [Hymenobacter cavernae]|uniref:Uncharacterized protein n=1 Tax=Hymenobacter cavernae TaxID=2044852 RepID=A0ABQ1TKZ5_9BACT|nr:hypothetical protein [Hymenobacter cavernae]GGE96010.1 hypothetical protein GCM10011383_03460 [Hymenobacter cavernae]
MMQKRKIYVLAGLLLCSASAFAQSEKKTAVDHKSHAALPVGPALPGEERLSAQERAERDFLMPTRRKKAAAATAKVEEAQQAALEVTARNLEATEATEPEEAAVPAAKTATRTYHRRSSSHRTTSTKHKTTSKSHSTKSKHVTKKPGTRRRR